MLGGVQLYKEPFLLPTENLTVGLGDTKKLSVSSGLEARTEGQGVPEAWGGLQTRPGPRGLERRWRPGRGRDLPGGRRRSSGTLGPHSQPSWNRLSDTHHLEGPWPEGKGQ